MKPMLAKDWDPKRQRWPVLASPKFDGIRALNVEGALVSRKLKLIPNRYIRSVFSLPRFQGIDGELISGKNFQETTSAVMSHGGEPNFTWHVFDNFLMLGPFNTRLERLTTYCSIVMTVSGEIPIKVVPHILCENEDELLEYEVKCLAQGHEGVMIRDLLGPYKFGRSTVREGWLLKVKRFKDSEAEIIGFEELLHNSNEAKVDALGKKKRSNHRGGMVPMNMLGAFLVTNKEWGEFSVGSGLTEMQRRGFWRPLKRDSLLGKKIKFKFQVHGSKDKPRTPIFLGFRED